MAKDKGDDAGGYPIGNTDPSKRGRHTWEKDTSKEKPNPKHPHRPSK